MKNQPFSGYCLIVATIGCLIQIAILQWAASQPHDPATTRMTVALLLPALIVALPIIFLVLPKWLLKTYSVVASLIFLGGAIIYLSGSHDAQAGLLIAIL